MLKVKFNLGAFLLRKNRAFRFNPFFPAGEKLDFRFNRLRGRLGAPALALILALSGCAGAPRNSGGPAGAPAWVSNPDAVYRRAAYIAAVGYGPSRREAEQGALVALTALFGQSIQGELKTLSSYSEAVKNGALDVSENTSMENAVNISSRMDNLVGAEVADVWFDGKSTHYAVAVMERAPAALLYSELIRSNLRIIGELLNLREGEKNSLDGYSRYLLAGITADANRVFANVLSVVDGSGAAMLSPDMKKGDEYRLEAANIAKNIPIMINAEGDPSGRIKTAFAEALNQAGFKSGGDSSRYVLAVSLALTPVELPNQQNKFVRYVIEAKLSDQTKGELLFPYSLNGREGHTTLPEAENRALSAAVKKIGGEYPEALKDWFAGALPKQQ
jgi:hypothetical protein